VNAGGDPGRDDYGLPPVDIEVPDDARALARDVQAYHRELRARRRQHLAKRLYGPLTRDGMVLPLLAGCLALTLLAATLLTVFTARQAAISLRPGQGASHAAGPSGPGASLLETMLFASGHSVILSSLPGAVLVLALVPPGCRRCLPDLKQLTVQAPPANIYLVGVRGKKVDGLARPLGLGALHALDDSENMLPRHYQVTALTAVVVKTDGTAIRVVPDRGHGFQISDAVRALSPASPASMVPAPTGKSGSPSASSSPAG